MQGDIVSGVLLPLILAFIMFSLGLGLTAGDFKRIFTQPRALLVGVVCHFVILPLACFFLLTAWGMTGAFAVGFMILAACPTGSTSNLLTYLARGDVALALSFTAVASVATRVQVACSMESSPTSDRNCLGKASRDSGHNRVPEPPDRMTGIIGRLCRTRLSLRVPRRPLTVT